jgi:hypothetical protein
MVALLLGNEILVDERIKETHQCKKKRIELNCGDMMHET